MTKTEFLEKLRTGLSSLPREEAEERLTFYSEMIDDRMEDGLSEEDAVAAVGTVDSVLSQIIAEIPLARLAKARLRKRRPLKGWETVLLAVGSPIWGSLLLAALIVAFSLYIVLWSLIVVIWAVFVAFTASTPTGIISGVLFISKGYFLSGLATIGTALFCGGVSVFLLVGARSATKGGAFLTKTAVLWLKRRLIKEELS